jgi:hypothetical protein
MAARWHFDPRDTPQQRAILRRSRTAQKVRATMSAGTRVVVPLSGVEGVVERHVPGTNAQGGSLTVRWDSGVVGRVTPINVRPVEP